MSNNQDGGGGGGLATLLGIFAIGYAIIETVNAVVAAITAFLFGLVTIALVASGAVALFWVYQYLSDKQYGEKRRIAQIEKLERERRATIARLPKHLREHADQYFKDKQQEKFEIKPQSRIDVLVERIRKWKKGGE